MKRLKIGFETKELSPNIYVNMIKIRNRIACLIVPYYLDLILSFTIERNIWGHTYYKLLTIQDEYLNLESSKEE